MRVQLAARALSVLAAGALLLVARQAHADGTLHMRGAYYKERATRVVQPMLDADLEVGDDGQLLGHMLVDSITSASAASGAAGEAFTERRFEAGAQYLHTIDRVRVGGGFRKSSESDYDSTYVNLRLEAELAQRNTTFALNVAEGFDSLDNSGSQGGLSQRLTGDLDATVASVSASQLLSPQSIISLSYDFMYLRGFLENPYRTVVAGGVVEPERVPDERYRHAIASTLKYYLDPTNTALIGAYRFYTDDWGILSNAPEVRIIQELGDSTELHLLYRYYRQRAADFYEDVYDSNDPTVEPYLTDDDKLGRMRAHTFGGKLGTDLSELGVIGDWSEVRIEGLFQYVMQDTHYGDAVISQLAVSIPLRY
jgi:hypothetical protein